MKISIIGLGWFGAPVAKELKSLGHKILGTTRSTEKKKELEAKDIEVFILDHPQLPDQKLLESDIIILNIPPFDKQLEWFKSWNWNDDIWIIFISSTSILKEEEEWIQNSFKNWTILRFGGLLGQGRHPGKYLSGRKNLKGRLWPVNLIHLEDCVGVTRTVIEEKLRGELFSVVADEHPSREEFYTRYCKKMNLPLPQFDQDDDSTKPSVSNEKIKKHYSFFKSLD